MFLMACLALCLHLELAPLIVPQYRDMYILAAPRAPPERPLKAGTSSRIEGGYGHREPGPISPCRASQAAQRWPQLSE